MHIKNPKLTVFVFDLDDTLFKEIDFLRSGFLSILKAGNLIDEEDLIEEMIDWYHQGKDVFADLIKAHPECGLAKLQMIDIYRNHRPEINLDSHASSFLDNLKNLDCYTALITDGRAVTQKNKIRALGLNDFFDIVVISEETGSQKPEKHNFEIVQNRFDLPNFIYFGDNYSKDFFAPNALGWQTVALKDDGRNIHKGSRLNLKREFLPMVEISSFEEVSLIKSNVEEI